MKTKMGSSDEIIGADLAIVFCVGYFMGKVTGTGGIVYWYLTSYFNSPVL